MKKFRKSPYVYIGILVLLFTACRQVDPPVFDNPHDPENPNFESPLATIVSPGNGQTINATTIIIDWTGKYPEGEYAYKLDAVDADYCNWQLSRNATYDYLDESTYTFYVKEKVLDKEQETPTQITFNVDAITQTGLILAPWHSDVVANTENYIDLWLEQVSAVKGLSTQLMITGITITRIEKNSTQWEQGSTSLAFITNTPEAINSSGIIEIDCALLGISNGFTGSAPLCRIYYKASSDGSVLFNLDITKLRNIQNDTLPVEVFREAMIYVE